MLFGALGAAVTIADTIRLFLKASDHSLPALVAWALWTLALFAPLAWAVRDRGRAPSYLALGYAMAILALRVVEVSMGK